MEAGRATARGNEPVARAEPVSAATGWPSRSYMTVEASTVPSELTASPAFTHGNAVASMCPCTSPVSPRRARAPARADDPYTPTACLVRYQPTAVTRPTEVGSPA